MSLRTRQALAVTASLAMATTVLGGPALAQDTGPDLFGTTYPERFQEGQPGGTLIVADWQEADLFMPWYNNNVTEADINQAVYGTLVDQTDDYRYLPNIAVSIPTIDNGGVVINGDGSITITWPLREGLLWSDGQPLTCDDFKFTAEWIQKPENVGIPAGKGGFYTDEGIAFYSDTEKNPEGKIRPKDINLTVECPTPTQMVWQMKEPYEGYILLMNIPLPRHYLEAIPIEDVIRGEGYRPDQLPDVPVGGPFKFQSVTPGQEVRVVRNDNYKDPITGGPAYLDGIVFKWYGDPSAMIAAYAGAEPEYDVAKDLNNTHLAAVEGYNDVVAIDSLTYEFLRPMWSKKECSLLLQPVRNGACPMSETAMRKALALALDREAINQRLLGGAASLAYTNVSPQAWFYDPPAEAPAPDPDAANAVLDEGDWPRDPFTGFRFKNLNGVETFTCSDDPNSEVRSSGECAADQGTALPVKDSDEYDARIEACTTTSQTRQDLLAMVSGQLNRIGVQVVISPVNSADIFGSWNEATEQTPCNLSHANFDLALHAYSVSLDPISNYGVYHSSQFDPNGQNNARVNNKELDRILTDIKNTVDVNEVLALTKEFQAFYRENALEVPVYFRKEVYIKSPTLMNFTGNPTTSGVMWNAAHWYLAEG